MLEIVTTQSIVLYSAFSVVMQHVSSVEQHNASVKNHVGSVVNPLRRYFESDCDYPVLAITQP